MPRSRIPLPTGTTAPMLIARGVATGTAWRAVQRGYLTEDYHKRTMAHDGKDELSECLGDDGKFLRNLSGKVVRNVIWSYMVDVHTVGMMDPGRTDYEDLVQNGILRCLELRSHPFASKAWYGRVIANETRAVLNRVLIRIRYDETHKDTKEITR